MTWFPFFNESYARSNGDGCYVTAAGRGWLWGVCCCGEEVCAGHETTRGSAQRAAELEMAKKRVKRCYWCGSADGSGECPNSYNKRHHMVWTVEET